MLPKWAAVELVGSSDEEEASAQLLQDNDALACDFTFTKYVD